MIRVEITSVVALERMNRNYDIKATTVQNLVIQKFKEFLTLLWKLIVTYLIKSYISYCLYYIQNLKGRFASWFPGILFRESPDSLTEVNVYSREMRVWNKTLGNLTFVSRETNYLLLFISCFSSAQQFHIFIHFPIIYFLLLFNWILQYQIWLQEMMKHTFLW